MMTRLCGTGLKEPVSTNDYMVSVMFYSDYSLNRLGFNITFTQMKGIYTVGITYRPFRMTSHGNAPV